MKTKHIVFKRPLGRFGWLVIVVAAAAITLSVVAITFLASNVKREVTALAASNADTTQWSMAQAEVELQSLQLAIAATQAGAQSDLSGLRRSFDVFYSRIASMQDGEQFADIRRRPDAADKLAAITAYLDRQVALIDGSDADLVDGLAVLARDTAAIRPTVREFSLMGVTAFAGQADTQREIVATLLSKTAYLTIALVIALISGLLVLVAMFRQSWRAEQHAAEVGARLEEVIKTSLDGIVAVDTDGRVVEYNGAAVRILGYEREEVIGRTLDDLIIPDRYRKGHSEGMKRYRDTGERRLLGKGLVRLEAKRKDGTIFPIEMSLSTARFADREIIVSFIRDISDRLAAEQELIAARDQAVAGERAKAELLAVMSHEMRTPLNGIMGTIQLIGNTRLTSKQSEYLAAMQTSASLLLHHVNGVLNMSRAEAGQLVLNPTETNPRALLEELLDSQRPAIATNGNVLTVDTGSAPKCLWIDPQPLRQIILNLVGNANKFTRNGEIRVECDVVANGDVVEFRVADTGIGIAEEDLDRIFEEFQTLDRSYNRSAEGTGLGLAICKRLVGALNGEIGVDSEVGEGSLFWVRVPMGRPDDDRQMSCQRQAGAKSGNRRARARAGALKILLVEDNRINRLVAREMLGAEGHRVIEAHDGREGIKLAASQPFDLILMDISMPEVDGVTATGVIRSSDGPNRATPIIALTAHALPEDEDRFLAAGIMGTLIKPLTQEALIDILDVALGSQPAGRSTPRPALSGAIGDLREQLGKEPTNELLSEFMREGERTLARLALMTETDIPPGLAEDVHKLAGSASVLQAEHLRAALQRLETDLRQNRATAAVSEASKIPALWQSVAEHILAAQD